MAITTLPTWEEGEIPTASKLNTLGSAIETKFAGAIGGADLAWPLVAQGNLDMAGFSVLSVKRFWNVFNADEYDTLQLAIDAAEAAGGGMVFIPPNVTITADGLTMTSGNIALVGGGASSVIAVTAAASSGFLLRTSAALSNFLVADLKIDGSTNAAAGQAGLYYQQATNVHIDNVIFNDCTGDMLAVRNDGTGGNNCEDVWVTNCRFINGDAGHILADDVDGLYVNNCRFDTPTTDCIEGVPSNASAKMRSIEVAGCKMNDCARAVYIVGGSGTANDLWRLVRVHDNEVFTTSGTAITVGAATAIVKSSRVTDNDIISAAADAILVRMSTGKVSGNYAPSAGGDGLDMTSSADIVIRNNDFPDAGARGIDATSSTNCRVIDNDVHNATTEGITRDSSTGLVCGNNHGDASPLLSIGITDLTGYTHTGDTADTLLATITVPANTISQVKQGMRITASGGLSGGAGSGAAQLEIGAVDVITAPAFNTGKWRIEATVMNTAAAVQVTSSKTLSNNGVSDDVGLDNNALTEDTTADFNVDIRVQLTNAGDTISLDLFTVEFIGLE